MVNFGGTSVTYAKQLLIQKLDSLKGKKVIRARVGLIFRLGLNLRPVQFANYYTRDLLNVALLCKSASTVLYNLVIQCVFLKHHF